MTTTVRVTNTTRDRVRRLSKQTQQSADAVVSNALDAYEDALYWARWREAAQEQTAELATAYTAETAAWDRATDTDAT